MYSSIGMWADVILCTSSGFCKVPFLQDLFKTVNSPEVILDFLTEAACAVQAFMKRLRLLQALTCSRRKDVLATALNHQSLFCDEKVQWEQREHFS